MAEATAWVMIPKLDEDKTGCVLDMRPLVLCKDCKYGKRYADGKDALYGCENGAELHEPYWFCADGEPVELWCPR